MAPKSKKTPAWLTIKKAIRNKKVSFRMWKSCPNEEDTTLTNKIQNEGGKKKIWGVYCQMVKRHNNRFFKFIRSGKPARRLLVPWLKESKTCYEEKRQIQRIWMDSSVWTEEKLGQIAEPELIFSGAI